MKAGVFPVIILFFIFLCTHCTNDLFDFTNRSILDPNTDPPEVYSFLNAREIHIAWEPDHSADEYILYRDTNFLGWYETICYQGKDYSFIDRNLESGEYYYYKLRKRKETVFFDKSSAVMGVAHDIRNDKYENNNQLNDAVSDSRSASPKLEMVDHLGANIYYYTDGNGNEIEDVDWYWINVPARNQAILRIEYPEGANLDNNDLSFSENTLALIPIESGIDIHINNYSYMPENKFFRIQVYKANFTDGIGKSGKVGIYEIHFLQYTLLPALPE